MLQNWIMKKIEKDFETETESTELEDEMPFI